MKSALLIALAITLSSVANAALPRGPEATLDYSYEDYLQEFPEKQQLYGSDVNSAGFLSRKQVFEKELLDVVTHNAQNHPWRKGLNQFSDMTMEEFISVATGHVMQPDEEEVNREWERQRTINSLLNNHNNNDPDPLLADTTNLPLSVDWAARMRGNRPRSQGKCGSCYSFVASALMELYASAQAGQHIQLSTQQAVSCFTNPRRCGGSGGCKGYTAGHVMDQYAKETGIVLEKDYPYVSGAAGEVPECTFDPTTMPVVVKTDGARRLTPNNPTEVLRALAFQGPVSVSVNGGGIKSYFDGVLTECTGPFNEEYQKYEVILSHAMIAVGYGVNQDGLGYWKLQNSWGDAWARDGYAYIYRPIDEPEKVYINTKPSSGYTCEDEDMSPFPVAGTCGVLANTWVPIGVQYTPPPKQ